MKNRLARVQVRKKYSKISNTMILTIPEEITEHKTSTYCRKWVKTNLGKIYIAKYLPN
jgi:hypothetical protein